MNPIGTCFTITHNNREFKEENRCVLSIIVIHTTVLVKHRLCNYSKFIVKL